MKEMIKAYFESKLDAMLDDIAELVAIPSVADMAEPGKPFGREPYRALETALAMAEGFGLKTKNYDGYVGAVDLNDGETKLAIFAHLDVVPAGDGWHSDPFRMIRDGDRIIGRGTSDDKGAAVAALYALRAIKDLNIPVKKNCRLVLGTNEECGSGDLDYYFSVESAPPCSFTPDSEFPVTNGEMGRYTKHFYADIDLGAEERSIIGIKAGEAPNAVPAIAEAAVRGVGDDELNRAAELAAFTGASFSIGDGRIVCTGRSAHASTPQKGINPITALFELLSHVGFGGKTDKLVSAMASMFPHGERRGRGVGVEMEDELGRLTLSLDMLSFDGSHFDGCFDTRTPMSANEENCSRVIAAALKANGFTVEDTQMVKPHYVDSDSDFIRTLLKNYELFSGDRGECLCTGGGTYVHEIEGGVAFGAISRGTDTNMHGADEFMLIRDILMSAEIFTSVIAEMCG